MRFLVDYKQIGLKGLRGGKDDIGADIQRLLRLYANGKRLIFIVCLLDHPGYPHKDYMFGE
jgi:hypothetical protein